MNKVVLFAVISTVIFAGLFPILMGAFGEARVSVPSLFIGAGIYFVIGLVVGKFSLKLKRSIL